MSLEERAETTEDLNSHFFVEARDMSVHRHFGDGSLTLVTPVANLHYDFLTPPECLKNYISRQAKGHKILRPYLDKLLRSSYQEMAVLVQRERRRNDLRETAGGIARKSSLVRSNIFSLFSTMAMYGRYNKAVMAEEGNVYGCEQLTQALHKGKECLDLIARRYNGDDSCALVEWQEAHKDLLFFSDQLLHLAQRKLDDIIDERSFFFPEEPYVLHA